MVNLAKIKPMHQRRISNILELASKICAVAVAPAMVLSTTAASAILFPLTAVLSIAAGGWRKKLNLIWQNPVTWASLLFYSLFLIGTTYSTAPAVDIFIALRKYGKFLLALVFLPIFVEAKWRNWAVLSFIGGITVILVVSYVRVILSDVTHFEVYRVFVPFTSLPIEAFRSSIVYSFLMAFASYLCLLKISSTPRYRLVWISLLAIIAYTLVFHGRGRSGYVVFSALVMLFSVSKFRWRGFFVGIASLIILFSLSFFLSSTFEGRVNAVTNEVKKYSQDNYNDSSVGLRITFVENSIKLIRAHHILGTGTGSYLKEYAALPLTSAEIDAAKEVSLCSNYAKCTLFSNPHNEYLYTMVQFGALGLIILLLFFTLPLWGSQFLPENEKYIARGIIISVMVGSLANSWLYDVTVRCCYAYFVMLAFAALPAPLPKNVLYGFGTFWPTILRIYKRFLRNC